MTVELSKEAQAFVQAQLATGDYADESEVVARALALWQRYQQQTAEIRASVEEGRKAAEEGRGTLITSSEEGEAFAHRLIARAKERRAARQTDAR